MRNLLLFLLCLSFVVQAAPDVEMGEVNQQQVRQPQTNNRKVLAQGCMIGGAIILLAGIGVGTGWVIDHSNSSINHDVDIDIDLDCEYPVLILSPGASPSPSPSP